MSSPDKQTSSVRERKEAKRGKKRKAKIRREGTTQSAAQLFGDEEAK